MEAIRKLRTSLAKQGLEAILVTDETNVRWLTGFSGTYGRVLVTSTDALFITDSRYTIQATEEVRDIPVAWFASPVDGDNFTAGKAKEMGIHQLGFESDSVHYSQWQKWVDKMSTVELVPVREISNLRIVKFSHEIETVRRACGVADAAFDHIRRMIQPGVTELDITLDLEFFIRRQGAGIAFPSIVVSGERSARPHGQPSDKKLENGDFVTMDFGATVDGYHSDITRTVVVGEASDRHREVYGAVLRAQLAAIDAIKPGIPAKDVDKIARDVLEEVGLAKYFGHGLGHGLGRAVHDGGRLSPTSTDIIEPGQIWTVEPGVYIPGFGGVRIEDDVVVTDSGVEILTHSTKELLELPLK